MKPLRRKSWISDLMAFSAKVSMAQRVPQWMERLWKRVSDAPAEFRVLTTGRRTMKAKNIFKTLAFAMLMPTILLTTACSDIIDNEDTDKKGYTLPVTVNVTRQGDEATTKTTYNDGTKKLSFSTGDKLFVSGEETTAGSFAGTLDYDVSEGTFSGTITTEKSYSGTANTLFTAPPLANAILLPAGHETYGAFSITENNGYDASVSFSIKKTFATSKALAIEQFSYEYAYSYSGGFALAPQCAILNFTIIGLSASTDVNVKFDHPNFTIFDKTVTTDGSGNATFAVGITGGTDLNALTLTVDGNAVTLVSSSKELEAGHIYNIGRSVSPLANVTSADLGKVIGADGNIYTDADAATAASTTAVARIVYVGSETGEASPYNHGLALALSDANRGSNCAWTTSTGSTVHTYTSTSSSFTSESGLQYNATQNSDTYPAFKYAIANNGIAAPTGCSAWFLASGYQWNQMISAAVGAIVLRDGFDDVGGTNMGNVNYWSSTEQSGYYAWTYYFFSGYGGGKWGLQT